MRDGKYHTASVRASDIRWLQELARKGIVFAHGDPDVLEHLTECYHAAVHRGIA